MLIISIPEMGGRGLTATIELIYGFYVMILGIKPYFVDMRNPYAQWCRNSDNKTCEYDWKDANTLTQKIIRVFNDEKELVIMEANSVQIEREIMQLDFDLLKTMGIEIRFVHLLSNDGSLPYKVNTIDRFEKAFPNKNLVIENQHSLDSAQKPLMLGKKFFWKNMPTCFPYSMHIHCAERLIEFGGNYIKHLARHEGILPQLYDPVILRAIYSDCAWFRNAAGIPLVFLSSIFSQRLLPTNPESSDFDERIIDWSCVHNNLHKLVISNWKVPAVQSSVQLRYLAHQLDSFYTALAKRHSILVTSNMLRRINLIDSEGIRAIPVDEVECFSRIRFVADPNGIKPGWDNTLCVDEVIEQLMIERR